MCSLIRENHTLLPGGGDFTLCPVAAQNWIKAPSGYNLAEQPQARPGRLASCSVLGLALQDGSEVWRKRGELSASHLRVLQQTTDVPLSLKRRLQDPVIHTGVQNRTPANPWPVHQILLVLSASGPQPFSFLTTAAPFRARSQVEGHCSTKGLLLSCQFCNSFKQQKKHHPDPAAGEP